MSNSNKNDGFVPDRIIHEPSRLQILSYLAVAGKLVPFSELKTKLELTAGNLSAQLKVLEENGYITLNKTFKHRRPLTRASLTLQGQSALQQYLQVMEKMINHLKKNATLLMALKEENKDDQR